MSILETFYILFKSNSSDLKKGTEEAESSTKKLQESLQNVNDNSEQVGRSFVDLIKTTATFFGVATAAYSVFNKLLQANDYALRLGDVSRALGVNAQQLDSWGKAVQLTGGSVDEFQQSLRGLSLHFGTSASIALKALPQLAEIFQKLGTFRSLQYGKILGLDEHLIAFLRLGTEQVNSIVKSFEKLGTVTDSDIDRARKLRIEQTVLDASYNRLALTLDQSLIPRLTSFYKIIFNIVSYLKQHKDFVIGTFIGIGAAATILLAPFIAANAAIIATAAGISILIGLFALAYEDIQKFFQGHESLTGDLLKKWPLIGTVVGGVLKGINFLLNNMIDGLKFGAYWLGKIASFFSDQSIISALDYLSDISGLSSLIDSIQNKNNSVSSPAFSSRNILNSQNQSRNTVINTGDININTPAIDAKGIQKALLNGIQDHLWQTNNQFANGVSY